MRTYSRSARSTPPDTSRLYAWRKVCRWEQVVSIAIGGKGTGLAYERVDDMTVVNPMHGVCR